VLAVFLYALENGIYYHVLSNFYLLYHSIIVSVILVFEWILAPRITDMVDLWQRGVSSAMNKYIQLKGKRIGDGQPCYVIAEMSANHCGEIGRALEIVYAAAESGADCIKTQTYTADTITMKSSSEYFVIEDGLWKGENLYNLYQKAYTPWDWQPRIMEEAKKVGLDFLSTPFDNTAVDFLEQIGVEFYKISSFELVDIPLLKYVAHTGKPIILSTGMATEQEIARALDAVRSAGAKSRAMAWVAANGVGAEVGAGAKYAAGVSAAAGAAVGVVVDAGVGAGAGTDIGVMDRDGVVSSTGTNGATYANIEVGETEPIEVSSSSGIAETSRRSEGTALGPQDILQDNILILKCSSAYPADPKDMNLLTIPYLKKVFDVAVGLSDHSIGIMSACTAVALGAKVIEKHFCTQRDGRSPDSAFSMTPKEFSSMVENIRIVEQSLGKVNLEPTANEAAHLKNRKSIFVTADIRKGEIFSAKNIRVIRPANGVAPFHYEEILGKPSTSDIKAGTPLNINHIAGFYF